MSVVVGETKQMGVRLSLHLHRRIDGIVVALARSQPGSWGSKSNVVRMLLEEGLRRLDAGEFHFYMDSALPAGVSISATRTTEVYEDGRVVETTTTSTTPAPSVPHTHDFGGGQCPADCPYSPRYEGPVRIAAWKPPAKRDPGEPVFGHEEFAE